MARARGLEAPFGGVASKSAERDLEVDSVVLQTAVGPLQGGESLSPVKRGLRPL